jgi:hypothetical protein
MQRLRRPYIDRSQEEFSALVGGGATLQYRPLADCVDRQASECLVLTPSGNVMSRNAVSWIAIFAGFASSGLALRVAFDLSVSDSLDTFGADLQLQSVRADVAALAALVSVIAHVIDKASK